MIRNRGSYVIVDEGRPLNEEKRDGRIERSDGMADEERGNTGGSGQR